MGTINDAVKEYLRYRGKLRQGLQLSQSEREDYESLCEVLDTAFSRLRSGKQIVEYCHPNRRKSVRFPCAIRVTYQSGIEFKEAIALNLSDGGIFIKVEELLKPGDKVSLEVRLREEGITIKVCAEVVWVSTGKDDLAYPRGMGLAFCGLTSTQRRALSLYLDGQTERLVEFL